MRQTAALPAVLLIALPLIALALPCAATPALAEDEWVDPRLTRIEEAIRELRGEADPVPLPALGDALVTLRHGHVHLVADLARVDVILEIQNTGTTALEWERHFAIDPLAEAIGATLQRQGQDAVEARTLTLEDARRLYDEVRAPRPPRTRADRNPWGPMNGTRDPLRLERLEDGLLRVVVWPVAPQETLRVSLLFVTPLRGRGDERVFVDPVSAELGATPVRPGSAGTSDWRPASDWIVHPGDLVLGEERPIGVAAAGRAGTVLRFVSASRTGGRGERSSDPPRIPFRRPEATSEVLAVRGGGLGTRVAVWRFDPARYLREKGVVARDDLRVRILARKGSTSRIAPWLFEAGSQPLPVTARLLPEAEAVHYAVEVRDLEGNVLHLFEESHRVNRVESDATLEGTVSGWHRAALVRRVLAWAGEDTSRAAQALSYAVDLGVLVQGTAALAVPREERRLLPAASRRLYHDDGAPLGAQGRQADLKWPPAGSTTP
jgi:hypothetical protein